MRRRLCLFATMLIALPCVLRADEQVGDYRIGPKDLLEIKVFEIPELNLERRVSDSGSIDLPLLGDLSVAGLSSSQVSSRIEALLTAKYVNHANVSVNVKEYANSPVSIVGAVQKPGPLNISGNWYLLQAISAAGGLTEKAGRKLYVLRRAPNGLSDRLEIRVDDLFRGDSSMWNIPIYPSDIVNIPPRNPVKIFCLGEVKNPGALDFESDDRITLLSVIAKAGGLTDRASNSVRIKRRGQDGKDVEKVVNFRRVVSGKDPDPALAPDDVIIVKESFF